jgi:hypothetical protein
MPLNVADNWAEAPESLFLLQLVMVINKAKEAMDKMSTFLVFIISVRVIDIVFDRKKRITIFFIVFKTIICLEFLTRILERKLASKSQAK